MFGDVGDPTAAPVPVDERGTIHENLRRVLTVLREQAIREVIVRFDGCGDDGAIDAAEFVPPLRDHLNITVEMLETVPVFDASGWESETQSVRRNLDEAVDVLAHDYVHGTDLDWSTGDGGFGELLIDVQDGTISLEINGRFTQSEVMYSCTRDIETEA
jgi:hypothetical protein